jgi:phosphoribosylformimino-5-aminoimidazole carboxamide ribotide isomerase
MNYDADPQRINRMRIIGVIDVLNGRAVHARGGRREEYAPVGAAAGEPIDGDPVALGQVYVDVLGVQELYLADLDAIATGPAAMNGSVIQRLATLGVPVWIDAGVATPAVANAVVDAGAAMVVVGLETLPSLDALRGIVEGIGGQRVAFSVDLRNGVPVIPVAAGHSALSATDLVQRAASAGVGTIIVLDLARVGTGVGIDLELVVSARRAAPGAALFAGGGVRNGEDLDQLAAAGCHGALVATALLSGALRLT